MAPAKFKDASYVLSYQDSLFPDQDRLVRTIQPKKTNVFEIYALLLSTENVA